MNVNIYLIRRTIEKWLLIHEKNEWPKGFFDFAGDPVFPSAEKLRNGLISPSKDPLS